MGVASRLRPLHGFNNVGAYRYSMAGKRRVRMRGVKHSSKRLEDELLERSRSLAMDPGLLRPQCAGNCRKCVFDKPFKNIDGLRKITGNPDALIKEASKFGGDDLVRAYAGTVSLAAAGSVPILASAKLGGDVVSYAVRGTVGADKLIGCQYYTDPKIRLMLYRNYVAKNKLHLYSFGEDLVCSDVANMPEDYLYDTFWETPYEFPEDSLSCGHSGSANLEITVKSLNQKVSICDNCAKDVSSLQYIVSRLAAIDPLDDITVLVRHRFHAAGEKDTVDITGEDLKKYMLGATTDRSLIDSVKRARMGDLRGGSVSTYVIGTKNYGDDLEAFLKDVTGDEKEIATLRKFLSENPRGIIVKTGRSSEVLSSLWEMDWKGIVAAHTDARTADAIGDASKNNPSSVLASAHNIYVSADVVASLPEFKKMGTVTTVADTFAKAGKVGGSAMIKKMCQTTPLKDSKSRVVVAAFTLACGDSEIPVKLSKEEREFCDYLVPFAKQVLEAQGEKYRSDMNTLLTACSCGEKV